MAPGAWAHRWIATSPETTEILFQIGGGNFVVGALEGSQYPPEAARLPTIGSLFNPSLEKTLELKPSLVVLDTHNINPSFATSLKALHVPTFTWDTSSPTSLLSEVRRFVAEQKISLSPQVALWEECVQSARTQPPTSALRYLAFVWMEPPIVLGSRAFLSQLLSLLGYENVVGVNLQSPYLPVTQEWILSQTMDRILYLKYRSDPEALFQTR
jgi:iron complex transport system substrate-binding protein